MELVLCYEHGISVDRDLGKVFELSLEASATGDIMSIMYLARCYELGIGTKRDLRKAAKLCRNVMVRCSWLSKLNQFQYGYFLLRGFGARKNGAPGLKILREGLATGYGNGWALYGD